MKMCLLHLMWNCVCEITCKMSFSCVISVGVNEASNCVFRESRSSGAQGKPPISFPPSAL